MTTPLLFTPLEIRGARFPNRIVVSPMCQYLAVDGRIQDWHRGHHARFGLGGVGAAIVEATGVTREGRITWGCTGLYDDSHVPGMREIVEIYHAQGALAGVQIGHAGRKASTARPWEGAGPLEPGGSEPAWETIAPSALPARPGWHTPRAMEAADFEHVREGFRSATHRALAAGFDFVEIHGAHGYLLHTFFSALANTRTDAYGGDLAGRMRLLLEVAEIVRSVWPKEKPVFYRATATDDAEGGITLDDTIALARELKARGVDVMDCSSGGIVTGVANAQPAAAPAPGHQVHLAAGVRRGADMATMAVGLIVDPHQAEAILQAGDADLIAIARELMADPNWPLRAAKALGLEDPYTVLPAPYAFYLRRRGEVSYPRTSSQRT
ncbi:NADH:flavin oxidoreductase/NADH oxidase [Salinarimonas sp. NSM]|uniref:NADH:flavin oxidoreductase/NADH oxidase n=1 Tax=Salinarimonas sp. NSM TaxID=3458003 RepID=UPI0040371DFB